MIMDESMDFETLLLETEEHMEKALKHTLHEFANIHTGKATPSMVENIQVYVEAYGSSMAIRELGAITTPDMRTLAIQPWDKSTVGPIEKAIRTAGLGLNPISRGSGLIVPVPELSGDRRRDLVKICSSHAEDGRVSVRQARHQAMDILKRMKTDGASEDDVRVHEKEVQTLTDKYTEQINAALKAKEEELLKV
jgi:ribosome recycling factor